MKKIKRRNQILLLALTLCSLSAWGCSEEVFASIEDYRAVVTIRADEAVYDFDNIQTYQLPDTVFDITEADQTYVEPDHSWDTFIIEELHTQLAAAGLTNVEDLANTQTGEIPTPDVIFTASLIAQSSWGLEGVTKWNELNRHVYYPSTVVEMSYAVESLIITMVSPNIGIQHKPGFYYALWTAGVHNAYADTSEETIRTGISTAFEQSPYIAATREAAQ